MRDLGFVLQPGGEVRSVAGFGGGDRDFHVRRSATAAKITNFSDMWVNRFALSPDGKWIAMSRGSAVRDAFLIRNFR